MGINDLTTLVDLKVSSVIRVGNLGSIVKWGRKS